MKTHRRISDKSSTLTALDPQYSVADRFIDNFTNYNLNIRKVLPSPGSSSNTEGNKINLTNFLTVYFDFTYFLLLCPFRISADETSRKFVIKKFKPQQVCCALMQGLVLIRLMTEVRVSIEKEYRCKTVSKNPVQYFNIILDVCSFVYKSVTMKRLWFNQMDYLNILNYVRGKSQFEANSFTTKALQNIVVLRCFFLLATTHIIVTFFMGKHFIDQSNSWSASLWRNQLVKLARFTFFLDNKFKKSDSTMLSSISATDEFLAFVMALTMLARYIVGLFSDIFILSFTLTLWTGSKSFSEKILEEDEKSVGVDIQWITKESSNGSGSTGEKITGYNCWSEVFGNYRTIQKLSMKINTAIGSQVTWYMAEAIMYYSVYLNAALTSIDIFVRVDLAVFYFNTFAILIFSADICSQMENVKLWISRGDNRKTVPSDEFSIVLHEMIAKDIGIRGSDIFTITYPLLAMFFSTIVTYFIICIQQGHDLGSQNGNSTITNCEI